MSDLTIEGVKSEVLIWRKRKQRDDRFPSEFWDKLIKLSVQHGLSKVTREFGVDFYTLKKKYTESLNQGSLSQSQICITKIPEKKTESFSQVKIEFENSSGFKLKILESSPVVEKILDQFFK